MEGYNFALKLNSKTLLGRTNDSMAIAAKIKESITKDDEGETQSTVTGHDITFKATAYARLNASSSTTQLDRDDVIELALAKGSSAVVPFVYGPTGADQYTGNVIITNYAEDSDSENEATINLDLKVTGSMTKVTSGGSS